MGPGRTKTKSGNPNHGRAYHYHMATLIPGILVANLLNIYVILLVITTIWMGIIGFIDDYIKIFKKNKKGLKGRFKVMGQDCFRFDRREQFCISILMVTMKEKDTMTITQDFE